MGESHVDSPTLTFDDSVVRLYGSSEQLVVEG